MRDTFAVLGACSLVFGAYLAWPPLAFVTGGVLVLGSLWATTAQED